MTKQEFLEIKELGIEEGVAEALRFCYEHDLYDFSDDYLPSHEVNNFLQGEGFASLYFKLKNIEDIDADYFYIDGYNNIRNVEQSDIDCMIDDILRDYEHLFEDDFEEWEEEEE